MPLDDPIEALPQRAALRHMLDRFNGGRPHQFRTLFGDRAAVHGGVGLPMSWSEARPGVDAAGISEPGHVPEFGDKHCGQDRTDTIDRGWGRMHPWAATRFSPGFVIVYGPPDDEELDTVRGIVAASHAYASGRVE